MFQNALDEARERHDRARPARGGARRPRAAEEGRVAAAEERPAEDPLLERPGDPRPHRRRPRLAAAGEDRRRARHQHEPDPPEGRGRKHVPARLRRMARGPRARGTVDRGAESARLALRGLQADRRREVRRSADGRRARRSGRQGRRAADAEEGRPGRPRRDLADRADRDGRRAELGADRRHAAPVREEHDRPRLQVDRRPEDVRRPVGPVVQRARAPRGRGRYVPFETCRRTSRRFPTTARWRT